MARSFPCECWVTSLWTMETHSKGYRFRSDQHKALLSNRSISLSLQSLSCQNGFFLSKKKSPANGTMEAGCLQSPVAMPTPACQQSFCSWAAGLFHIHCLSKCTQSEIETIIYIRGKKTKKKHMVPNKSALSLALSLKCIRNVLFI